MRTLSIEKITPTIGAEVTDVDLDRLLNDDEIPGLLWDALRDHGVLLMRGLGLDVDTQVEFGRRMGEVDLVSGEEYNEPGVMRVSMDPNKNGGQETVRGTFNWHMDGCSLPPGRNISPMTILTSVVLSETGGQTEFASTRAFFDSLSDDEKNRLAKLRVVHSVAGSRRRVIPHPTAEQEALWATLHRREHPLVWRLRKGLPSLLIGGTSECLVGMPREEGLAILDDLTARATAHGRVYRHEWSVGDTIMWDNLGLLHRVEPYEDGSKRELIRTTLVGDEPTE